MVRKSAMQLAQRKPVSTETGRTFQVVLNSIILAANAKLMLRHILALVQVNKRHIFLLCV